MMTFNRSFFAWFLLEFLCSFVGAFTYTNQPPTIPPFDRSALRVTAYIASDEPMHDVGIRSLVQNKDIIQEACSF